MPKRAPKEEPKEEVEEEKKPRRRNRKKEDLLPDAEERIKLIGERILFVENITEEYIKIKEEYEKANGKLQEFIKEIKEKLTPIKEDKNPVAHYSVLRENPATYDDVMSSVDFIDLSIKIEQKERFKKKDSMEELERQMIEYAKRLEKEKKKYENVTEMNNLSLALKAIEEEFGPLENDSESEEDIRTQRRKRAAERAAEREAAEKERKEREVEERNRLYIQRKKEAYAKKKAAEKEAAEDKET